MAVWFFAGARAGAGRLVGGRVERSGAKNGRIARIILLSRVLAFFGFSAAVALLT